MKGVFRIALLASCLASASIDALAAEGAKFAQVLEPAPIVFPRDHGPHPEVRQEWWYFTGNLDGAKGERFGFELTFFRVALAPGLERKDGPQHKDWRARQFYFAHFAVTDRDRRAFHSSQRFARDALDLAGAQDDPFHVWLQSWSVQQDPASGSKPVWILKAADAAYALELRLEPGTPVLNGERGFSRKSAEPGAASYYYSIPRLKVSGSLKHQGQDLSVSGLAWLDREWGSGVLGAHEEGWDWFALQLDDGSSLMYYRLRKRGGQTDQHSAGTWIESSGTSSALTGRALAITSSSSWKSPRGGLYPARWRLQLGSQQLDIEVHPILADQELTVSPRYWEGAVDVRGTRAGQPVAGRGYVELVGYARDRE